MFLAVTGICLWRPLIRVQPFQRAIQGRAKLARKQSQMSESTDEALSRSLQELKDAFPRASLPKGNALDLIFTPSSWGAGVDLTLEEGGKVLGRVESPRGSAESQFGVARQLMLAYMADKDEISKPVSASNGSAVAGNLSS